MEWSTGSQAPTNAGDDANSSKERTMKQCFEGGCLCGGVRYVADGEPINIRVRHCRLCQRSLGAAFNARVLMPIAAVTLQGPLGRHHSSPGLIRGFCQNCGTTLFSQRPAAGVIGLTCGSLDEPDLFQPTEHIWTSRKQAWIRLDDGLPQYPEGAAP
jgi:hypothetical protein